MKSTKKDQNATRGGAVRVLAAVLLIACAVFDGSAAAGARELFGDAQDRGAANAGRRPTDMRKRRVQVDLSALAGADVPAGAESVGLNLFADTNLTAVKQRFERRGARHFTWVGKVPDDPLSMVVLVAGNGQMEGTVFARGKHFSIRGADAASQEVAEVDQSAFPSEACDKIPVGNPATAAAVSPSSQAALADSGSFIDVLVVYTPAARIALGGTDPTAIQLRAQLAVDATNTTYANSGVTTRLRLAHTEEVAYTESGDWNTDLTRLENASDGYMDNVHALRDAYRADVVALLIKDPQYCGLAGAIMATSSSAFCLVYYECAVNTYTFAHEIGHLQGARHDRYVDPVDGPFSYIYNHGDVDLVSQQRTIMAYNDQCTDNGLNCTRVPYWSNPGVYYPGTWTWMGDSVTEDNARVLNNTASVVANFRQGLFTLTVGSTYPVVGVPIAVAPLDSSSLGDGTTSFTRSYTEGTAVTLTAPLTADGNPFAGWSGCASTSGTSGSVCSVTMDSTKTVTANYVQPRVLSVESTYPAAGVPIAATPLDKSGLGDGSTSFTRLYAAGAAVTLTAPLTADGNPFAGWSGCASTSGTSGSVCSVTMDSAKTVTANYLRDLTLRPIASVLWSRGDTGQAAIWEIDPSTYVLQNVVWLPSSAGVGAPWQATSYTRVDAATGYVLWTRSDTGQAIVWTVNPATGAIASWAYLYSSFGVGRSWLASQYTFVNASKALVLWTNSGTGQAILWTLDPSAVSAGPTPTMPVTAWAYLGAPTGVGARWQANSYRQVSTSSAYVLWTNSDTGQAILWTVDPSAVSGGPTPTIAYTSWAFLGPAGGVGAHWQASDYELVNSSTGYVLWTNSDTGQAILWTVDPSAVSGGPTPTISYTAWTFLGSSSGTGAHWQSSSYLPVNKPPTLDTISPLTILEDAAATPVNLTGISAGATESQPLSVTATSSNTSLIPNPTVTYASPGATGTLSLTPMANANGSATITVWVNDGQSTNNPVSRSFIVTVTPVNDAPTDISLSSNTADGALPAGTTVGTLSTTDPDGGVAFTYAVVGEPGTDYTLFQIGGIAGDMLQTSGSLDYTGRSSFTVRVRSTDPGALWTEKTFTVVPPAYALWTRRDTGQAVLWQLNPATSALGTYAWLYSSAGAGASWEATSYVHRDGKTGHVLWTNSDTGQALLWTIDPSTVSGGPTPTITYTAWAFLGSSTGVGAHWQATSYTYVNTTTGYLLWTNRDTGQAILWTVDPSAVSAGPTPTIPITAWAFLGTATGVGAQWQATSYTYVNSSTGYLLWTNSDSGLAILWTVDPGAVTAGPTPTIPYTAWAYLGFSTSGGSHWMATSYEFVNATTGYVLWTWGASGEAILWTVDPSAVSAGPTPIIPYVSWARIGPTLGVGAPWEAGSYAR